MIVDELITLLTFDTQGMDKAKAFQEILDKIEENSKKIVLSLTGAISAVGFFADRVSKSVAENYEWAKSVGVATDSYQRFEHAASLVGAELGDIKGDLEDWVRSAKASGQTLEEVFLKETENIKNMSAEQSYALLKARNYSDSAIRIIQKGQTELKKIFENTDIIPEKNLKAAKEYTETWRSITFQVTKLFNSAVAGALPGLEKILVSIQKFVEENKELVKGGVSVFFDSVAASLKILFTILFPVIQAISFLLKVFDKMTFGFGKYVIAVGLLTGAFTALGISMAVNAVRGVAFLMGSLGQFITVLGTVIGALAEFGLALLTGNVKQMIFNSTLFKSIALWWMQLKAVTANLALQIKALSYIIMETLALIKQNLVRIILNTTIGRTIALYVLLSVQMLKSIGLMAKMAITTTAKMIPALIAWATAVTTTAGVFIGALIPAIISATVAVWSFTVALLANPVTWIVLAVVATIATIVGLIVLIIKYWDKIVAGAQIFWNVLKSIYNWLKSSIVSIFDFIVGPIKNIGETIWNSIVFGFEKGVEIVKSLSGVKYWDKIVSGAQIFWNVLKSIYNWLKSSIISIFDFIVGPIKNLGETIWNSIVFGFEKGVEMVKKLPGIKWLLSIFDKLSYLWSNKGGKGKNELATSKEANNVIRQFAPPNTVAVPVNPVASSTNTNQFNNQRSNSYTDNRNITINTNATSGPAIATYLKENNNLMSGGFGMAGVY